MPRTARFVHPGVPYRVAHRGNRGQPIFLGDDDRALYVALLAEEAARARLALWAWRLAEGEVLLLAVPEAADSLARAIGLGHRRFAQAMNRRHGWRGHLFEGRFQSCALDPRHAQTCLAEIEGAPAEEWSSARARATGEADPLVAPDAPAPRAEPATAEELDAIRRAMLTGRPCGDAEWVRDLERASGRTLLVRPRGRPRQVGAHVPQAAMAVTGAGLAVELL